MVGGARLRSWAGVLLGAAVAVVALATPAVAADTHVRVTSLRLDHGQVDAQVRLRCTGGGVMRWDVGLTQGTLQDQVRGRQRCDGAIVRRTVRLAPARGSFHPGDAILEYGASGPCREDVCTGWGRAEPVVLSRPPCPGHPVPQP